METLLGEVDVAVETLQGATEVVRVLQLPIRQMPALAACIDDEERMAALYVDKEPGWSASIKREGIEAIIAMGERLNSDFFERWLQRRMARQERVLGKGYMEKLVTSQLGPSTSATTSGSCQPKSGS